MILAILAQVAAVSSSIELSPLTISLLTGTVVPILTGFATKLRASDTVKALVALVMSVAAGTIIAVVKENPVTINTIIMCAGAAFATNVVSYHGAYKPISSTNQPPGAVKFANFGIGKPVAPIVPATDDVAVAPGTPVPRPAEPVPPAPPGA